MTPSLPRDGAAPAGEEVITYCRERLAVYKALAAIDFVPALPKSTTGKVLKRVLRQQGRQAQHSG